MTVLAVLAVCFSGSLLAAEPAWPAFHGPKADNISTDTGLLKTWPEGGPKLLWRAEDIGNTEFPGYSGVVIADGRVFTTGNVKVDGDEKDEKKAHSFLFALDFKTGKELWRYDNGPGWTDGPKFPGDRNTPTIDGNRVYAFSALGMLACVEAESGKEIWKRNLREEADATLPNWAYAESPVVDGDLIVCWPGGKKASVMALNKRTGEVVWTTPSIDEVAGYATMIAFEQDGLRIYANMTQRGFLAVNAKNGEKLFYHKHPAKYDINATMPYYFDGKILLSSGYGTTGTVLLKLTVDGENASVEQIWHQKKLDNQHGLSFWTVTYTGRPIITGVAFGCVSSSKTAKSLGKTGESVKAA